MSQFYVERQGWQRWPRKLIMCKKTGYGIERKRYVPEGSARKALAAEQITDAARERTCKDVGERHDFACSDCGARLYTEMTDGYTMILGDEKTILLKPRYCPNCGARVVE